MGTLNPKTNSSKIFGEAAIAAPHKSSSYSTNGEAGGRMDAHGFLFESNLVEKHFTSQECFEGHVQIYINSCFYVNPSC